MHPDRPDRNTLNRNLFNQDTGNYMQRTKIFILAICVCLLIEHDTVYAQDHILSYEQVFITPGKDIFAKLPTLKGWIDRNHYLVSRDDPESKISRLIRVNAVTGEESLFIDFRTFLNEFPDDLMPDNFIARSDDYMHLLYRYRSDLYYFKPNEGRFRRLTATEGKEENATFSPDHTYLAYTRNNNLFVVNLISGLETQLTADGSTLILNGKASWVYYEEILGRKSRYKAFWWSPQSDKIAFLKFDDTYVPQFTLVSADGIHGRVEVQHYPKAGDPLPGVRLGLVDIRSQKLTWINREIVYDEYVAWPVWSPDGQYLYYQRSNRNQDHLQLLRINTDSYESALIYEELQKSWVGFIRDMKMLPGGSGFILRSDKAGWSNLYHYEPDGKLVANITNGRMAVSKILSIDISQDMVFFEGWRNRSEENHLFRVQLDGNNLEQITKIPGTHSCQIAPGSEYFYDSYSSINQPLKRDLYYMNGRLIRTIGDKKLPEFSTYDLGTVEFISIPTGDGFELPALWVLPPDFDRMKKYPVLFRVYGGPSRSSVKNSYRPLRDLYLAQHGIITMAVDHRGSGHFGKAGKEWMHRNLGKYEIDDLVEAVKWLYQQPFTDSTRIGISGGSYGGYVTCLALTYGADYFTHGIADYPVTDWQLYDATYTERFMEHPLENPEGYQRSSVMTHAQKYHGNLMLIHGTMDDNVHMQNTLRLVDELTNMDKDFELVLVPDSRHGTTWSKRKFVNRKKINFWFRNFLHRQIAE